MNLLKLNCGDISTHRSSMMGVAIIMILLCHAKMDGAPFPDYILRILTLGNWGVDIFLLLSGVGLFFSLHKNRGSLWSWYLSRFKRILVPYLALETPFWIYYVIDNGLGIGHFFYYISLLSFWIEHVGLWFLALLIPLYIIAPPIYIIFNNKYRYYICAILVLICLVLPSLDVNNDVVNNILSCVRRVPSFLVGLCIGFDVKQGNTKKYYMGYVIGLYIIAYFMNFSKDWLWALLLVGVFVIVFNSLGEKSFIYSVFKKVGFYTLELYIGLDITKNILDIFLEKGPIYWIISIIGSIIVASTYNVIRTSISRYYDR